MIHLLLVHLLQVLLLVNHFQMPEQMVFLSGDPAAQKLYAGQFMSQYSWAEDTAAFLEPRRWLSSKSVKSAL